MTVVVSHGDAPAIEREAPVTAPPPPRDDPVVWIVDAEGRRRYLPRRPRVALDGHGRPVFSLTLLLDRTPGPDQGSILELVQQAQLAIDLTLGLPADALGFAGQAGTAEPVFVHDACFRIQDDGGQILGEVPTSGPAASAGLSILLDAANARSVVAALSGEPGPLRVLASVAFDEPVTPRRLVAGCTWASLYDAIAAEAAGMPVFGTDVLERAVLAALERGNLQVTLVPAGTDAATSATTDLAGLLLRRLLPSVSMILEPVPSFTGRAYRLGTRPDPQFDWRWEETVRSTGIGRRDLECPLDQLLGGLLDGLDWDAYVHLISPQSNAPGTYATAPRRSYGRAVRSERTEPGDTAIAMTAVGGRLVDASTATFTARPLLRPSLEVDAGSRQLLLADAFLGPQTDETDRSLPVYTDSTATLMPDRHNGARYWYVPALELVLPAGGEEPETSPFLLRFERQGMTESGEQALTASIRCTLRFSMSDVARQALTTLGDATAQPVDCLDLAAELSLPFVDSTDGQAKRTTLRPRMARRGDDVILDFDVANHWVRLAYGVLSSTDAEGAERAILTCAFRFACYRKVQSHFIRPLIGFKDGRLPVDWSDRPDPGNELSFHARSATLFSGTMQVRLVMADVASRSDGAVKPRLAMSALAMARPISDIQMSRPLPLEVRPDITDVRPSFTEFVYIEQSVGIQSNVTALAPCNQFGAYYQEQVPEGWRGIGCQDAFRLGQVPARLYEPLAELATPRYTVFRNLAQPGRFLLLPKTYCITRYPPAHERAYLAAAMVYAALDPESAANNRYRFVASLEPDIPAFALRALRVDLGRYAPAGSVAVDLPTDVAATTDLPSMALPGPIAPPRFTIAGAGVQVVLETALPDALILRTALQASGISGRLEFTLADSTTLASDVDLRLGHIDGPWGFGPVAIEACPGGLRLTNRTERSVDVSELRLYPATITVTSVPVSQRLDAGAVLDVAVERDLTEGEAYAVYTLPPNATTTLEESRIYIEDVSVNVVFTCGINYQSRGLSDLEVYARLAGDAHPQQVVLQSGTPRVGEARFTAPLTSVVGAGGASTVVEYRVVRVTTAGERIERAWAPCPGALVDLQWDLITS